MSKVNILQTDSFAELRQNYGSYVDKTGFLEEFFGHPAIPTSFASPAAVTLFTRPRGFGKSLFLSMLAEFLALRENEDESQRERRRALFRGLKVTANEQLCAQLMHQFPVIFLSLKTVGAQPDFACALEKFRELFASFCREHAYLLASPGLTTREKTILPALATADKNTLVLALDVLVTAMACHYQKPAVVLIDDYDAPLESAARYGYSEQMTAFLRQMLSWALKTNVSHLKFAILTGCLRVARVTCCYEGMNHLDCWSFADPVYQETFGFTPAEVDTLLADAGLSHRREEVRAWYGGYRAEAGLAEDAADSQELFCPASLLHFVAAAQRTPDTLPGLTKAGSSPDADAALTISPAALLRTILRHPNPDLPGSGPDLGNGLAALLAGGCLVGELEDCPTYAGLDDSPRNLQTLLFATGCLTRASATLAQACGLGPNDFWDKAALVLPNAEGRTLVAREVLRWFRETVREDQEAAIRAALWQADAPGFERALRSSALVPGTDRDCDLDQTPGHALLAGFLLANSPETYARPLQIKPGQWSEAPDRCFVLQVTDQDRALLLEIRHADWSENVADLVLEGHAHLREQPCAARLLADPALKTVLHWSIVFRDTCCRADAVVVRQA